MRFHEMKIGEVAKAAGIGIDAVRFYERQGLIPKPPRRPSGYRMYSRDVILSLRFIKQAKELGCEITDPVGHPVMMMGDFRGDLDDRRATRNQA